MPCHRKRRTRRRCFGSWLAGAKEAALRGFRVQGSGLRVWHYRGYVGIMEKKMETTIMGDIGFRVYRGFIGIMEKKMETTVMGYIGFRV